MNRHYVRTDLLWLREPHRSSYPRNRHQHRGMGVSGVLQLDERIPVPQHHGHMRGVIPLMPEPHVDWAARFVRSRICGEPRPAFRTEP